MGEITLLLSLPIRTQIPLRAPSSRPHLDKTTHQRSYLLIPSHWGLGLQSMNVYEIWTCRSSELKQLWRIRLTDLVVDLLVYTTGLHSGHLAQFPCLAGYDGISETVPKGGNPSQWLPTLDPAWVWVNGGSLTDLALWVNKADQPWQGLNQQLHPPWRRLCSSPLPEVGQVWVCFSASVLRDN